MLSLFTIFTSPGLGNSVGRKDQHVFQKTNFCLKVFWRIFEVIKLNIWSFFWPTLKSLYLDVGAAVCGFYLDLTVNHSGCSYGDWHCSEPFVLNVIMLMVCVWDKATHVDAHTDPQRHMQTHTYVRMAQYLREIRGGAENHFETIYPWIKLQSGSTCHSAALPPTGLWGEGLTADGWADTGGIWFIGWVSICGLRI